MFKLSSETLWQKWAPLPLRLIIGCGFLAHGALDEREYLVKGELKLEFQLGTLPLIGNQPNQFEPLLQLRLRLGKG